MENDTRILGVIGGLGPLAASHFMELVSKFTDAATDQEHLHMIVYSFPSIPDPTDFIMGYYLKSPLHRLLYVANALSRQNVDLIAIPSITAHYFYDSLSERISLPIIHAVEETARHLEENGVKRVGIMASEGTITSGIYQKALKNHGIETVIPSRIRQEDVNYLIYQNIKSGQQADMTRFYAIADELRKERVQVIILGCTELSLIKRDHPIGPGFLDSMEVLAQQAVLRSGKALKPDKRYLIT